MLMDRALGARSQNLVVGGWPTEFICTCAPRTIEKQMVGGSAPAPWVAFARAIPGPRPYGQPVAAQIRSRRICLCLPKDNFAGSKIGRTQCARRARAKDGAGQKRRKERAPPGLRPPTSRVPSRRVRLRGCADATSLSRRRTLAILCSPLRARASASLGARLDRGGCENTSAYHSEVGCSTPRSAGRVPQTHREYSSESRV